MIDDQLIQRVSLFHPFTADAYRRIIKYNTHFVHYTTAETAANIIRGATVWMRNARVMNDFSEIEYGVNRLAAAYNQSPVGKRLKRFLDDVAPGISAEIEALYNGWHHRFAACTYLACVSEHHKRENQHGRLSMWRAYGGQTSVALVMKHDPFLSPVDVIHAYSSPVLYADQPRFNHELSRLANNLKNRRDEVALLSREEIKASMFAVFYFAALCTKHPGFHEEREWRVIHSTEIFPSDHVRQTLETVRGVPQMVSKLPLHDIEGPDGERFTGATVPDLLERVIIGPSDAGPVLRDAFVHLLDEAGVPDPASKVFSSGIPLRSQL
jgi:hypothetical protein